MRRSSKPSSRERSSSTRSRGAVVDTPALKAAIKSARLTAVALDVWENEPDIDVGLLEMVDLGSPHIAGYSFDGKVAGMIMIYRVPLSSISDWSSATRLPISCPRRTCRD